MSGVEQIRKSATDTLLQQLPSTPPPNELKSNSFSRPTVALRIELRTEDMSIVKVINGVSSSVSLYGASEWNRCKDLCQMHEHM